MAYLLLLLTFLGSIFADDPICPFGYTYQSDFQLCISKERWYLTWRDAAADCARDGATLPSIHNAFQNSLLAQWIREGFGFNDEGTWLGAVMNANGNLTWMDGTPFNYQHLTIPKPYIPTHTCLTLGVYDLYWIFQACWDDLGTGIPVLPYFCTQPVPVLTTVDPTITPSPPSPPVDLKCLPAERQPLYNCQKGWVYSNETGYQYKVIFDRTYDEGEAFCVTEGGHLVSIHSDVENRFVTNLCCASTCENRGHQGEGSSYLTGGYRYFYGKRYVYNWVDGSPFDYNNTNCQYANIVEDNKVYVLNWGTSNDCGDCGKRPGVWPEGGGTLFSGDNPYLVCKKKYLA